jgi:nucleoside-diphosphate-sugar epimerase
MASSPNNILIIGGSGFLSGTLTQVALARGINVWAITRGQRPLAAGVKGLTADRHDAAAFAQAVAGANTKWDMVIDCIGFTPEDARQDVEIFGNLTQHLVFVSTDFVYDPARRQLPQGEETDRYLKPDSGSGSLAYGGKKRAAELELIKAGSGSMAWSVVRPCHIYGPGSRLGCLPLHGRDPQLLERLQAGETLKLVGGGHFLQQPILARDLSELMLNLYGNEQTYGQIFCTTGPDTIESRDFYRIIADILGVGLSIEEVSISQHLAEHPEAAPFLCHRMYSMDKLRACGVPTPGTPIEEGLREHVESLQE